MPIAKKPKIHSNTSSKELIKLKQLNIITIKFNHPKSSQDI